MIKATHLLAAAALLSLGLEPEAAQAQAARTFVSANGSDSNPCSRAQPCRTLAGAILKTNAKGEINMLDPAGYGTVVIDKAISIVNDGVGSAGVLVGAGLTGITINAGVDDAVNLRGLIIEGTGVGVKGIQFNTGKSLTIENCVIRNLTTHGILFVPNASSTLAVSNTLVSDIPNDYAIYVHPTGSGTVQAVFNRVEAHNSQSGIYLRGDLSTGTVKGTIEDSVASNHAQFAFYVGTVASLTPTSLMVVRSAALNSSTGIRATGPGATLRVAESVVTGNATTWFTANSGTLLSYGNNYMDGNGDGDPAPPTTGAK
jgi:hypothetical protein